MPVTSATPVKSHTGNGVTTVFPYDFRILKNTDLKVTVDGVTKTLTTDYTVSGVGDSGGGNVTFVSAPANGAAIVLEGNASYDRTTDYQRGGGFDEETVDNDFDRTVILIKQLKAILDRVPQLKAGLPLTQPALPDPVSQRFLRWKSDLSGLENLDIAMIGALAVSNFMKTVLDDTDADSAVQTYIAALTAETAVAKDDTLILGDTSEGKGNKVTLENLLKVINLLTEDAAPDAATDYGLVYDASAGTVKKVLLSRIGPADALVFKGVINCAANPNYPTADAGHVYRVSVAGKIGGAAGPNVEVGDILTCLTDGSAAGDHATVGANWTIMQANIDGWAQVAILGAFKDLLIFNNTAAPNSAVNIQAAEVVLKDASGNSLLVSNVNLANQDISAKLDTGAEQASQWHYIWLFSNGAAVDMRYSLSLTAPVAPDGYNYKALVGVVRNGADSNFLRFLQIDHDINVSSNANIVMNNAAGTGGVAQAIDLQAFVPPIAKRIRGSGGVGSAGPGSRMMGFASRLPDGSYTDLCLTINDGGGGAGALLHGFYSGGPFDVANDYGNGAARIIWITEDAQSLYRVLIGGYTL